MSSDWREKLRPRFEQTYPPLLDGDSSNFHLAIHKVKLKSGAEVIVEPGTVTAIVGANNAGKSTFLREVVQLLQVEPHGHQPERLSVESLELVRQGDVGDFVAWLADRSTTVINQYEAGFQRMGGSIVNEHHAMQAWDESARGLGVAISQYALFYANADARLSVGGSAEMRDTITAPPTHPVHYLQDDKRLLATLTSITERIFGQSLTLDTLSRTIRLRVGKLDQEAPPINDIPTEYAAAMAALRPLDEQGDGMRSLLGQLLPILTGAYPIVLIDEPEAFLHPPQAHALGVQLGQRASEHGTQVIVATHDRNLLAGLLSSGVKTSVVRLSRPPGGEAAAYQLDSAELEKLWTDPVLKYTNVLDGLFHRLVVLAEAEGDCGFLSAGLDCTSRKNPAIPPNEVLFVPTGGKDGMAKVANALRAVRVPVIAAPDLDRLSDKTMLRRLVESVGSDWTEEMSAKWDRSTVDLRAKREPATVGHVLDGVTAALKEHRDEPYSGEYRDLVKAHIRTGISVWETVKKYGVAAFDGEARGQVDELIDLLDKSGVVLVREGELERLAPEVTVRKGPGWLQSALERGAQCNRATQEHLDRIVGSGSHRA